MIGKVLDASTLAALVRGSIAAQAWFSTARQLAVPLYVPSLAFAEVRAVRPDAGPALADLLAHPSVVLGEIDAATAAGIEELLERTATFDALAGQVVHVALRRGWPALSEDPGRLWRLDPGLDVDRL